MPLTCRADKKAVRKTISPSNEPDLFWGMRGAGGNLGVAIEYTTYAFAVPDIVRSTVPPRSYAPGLHRCVEMRKAADPAQDPAMQDLAISAQNSLPVLWFPGRCIQLPTLLCWVGVTCRCRRRRTHLTLPLPRMC